MGFSSRSDGRRSHRRRYAWRHRHTVAYMAPIHPMPHNLSQLRSSLLPQRPPRRTVGWIQTQHPSQALPPLALVVQAATQPQPCPHVTGIGMDGPSQQTSSLHTTSCPQGSHTRFQFAICSSQFVHSSLTFTDEIKTSSSVGVIHSIAFTAMPCSASKPAMRSLKSPASGTTA